MPADLVRSLRPMLVVALTLVIASAAMGFRAWQRHEQFEAMRIEREQQVLASFHSVQQMRRDLVDAENHEARYRELVASGVVGPWDKLATIDRLEGAFGLWPGVFGDYSVTTATGAFPAGIERAENHGYREVVASLALTPRHELELAAVIDAAAAGTQPGDVAGCDIRRGDGSPLSLQVSCSLVWHGFERLPVPGAPAAMADASSGASSGATSETTSGATSGATVATNTGPAVASRPRAQLALGTLFFTPAERARAEHDPEAESGALSATPSNVGAGATLPASMATQTIDRRVRGYVRRSDGDDVVWVDGAPLVLERPADLDERTLRLAPHSRTRPLVGADAAGGIRRATPPAR
ncbi:MAG: hypothetical protein ABWZ78_00605 [Burkholderiaceae bacterium]